MKATMRILLYITAVSAAAHAAGIGEAIVSPFRRILNLGSIFGSPHSVAKTPYEKVLGSPVFQVTTAWGSAYMNMEKLTDMEDSGGTPDGDAVVGKKGQKLKSINSDSNQYRTVALYYLDPDDALAAHAELKQMEQMKSSDIRITSTSLGRALRSAANLGNGLVTGLPLDALTGRIKPVEDGGSLRHKVVPPKRQLFYAARCLGKERVGLFSESSAEDAAAVVRGNAALAALNIARRREKRERKGPPKAKTPMQAANAHMEGYVGVPVFWAHGMQRRQPRIKQLFSGNRIETPMFMNYEDLQMAWGKMRKRNSKLPEEPVVEVFNLWDVLTSMDKQEWLERKRSPKFDWTKPLLKRISSPSSPGLDTITFVPSSAAIDYKEKISARGNGKARLRPMR